MKCKFLLVGLFFALLTTLKPANACPDWDGRIIDNQQAQWNEQINPMNIQVVEDPLGVLGKVTKFTIGTGSRLPDTASPSELSRVELMQQACASEEGEKTFIAWNFYLEKPFTTTNEFAYWGSADSFSKSMGFSITPGGMHNLNKQIIRFFSLLPNHRVHWQYPVKIGVWHQIAMEIHWSKSAEQGEVSVWFNNNKVVDSIKLPTKADQQKLFIHLGLLRNQSGMQEDSIYISNAVEGQNIEDLLN